MRTVIRSVAAALLVLALLWAGGPGFRSRQMKLDHFAKHGKEFGNISVEQYLSLAQQLRDASKGGDILEAIRDDDHVITRFNKKLGYFGAYNSDRTIRTFFIPVDGVRYFQRQARRPR